MKTKTDELLKKLDAELSKDKQTVWTGFFEKNGIIYFLKKGEDLFMPIFRKK